MGEYIMERIGKEDSPFFELTKKRFCFEMKVRDVGRGNMIEFRYEDNDEICDLRLWYMFCRGFEDAVLLVQKGDLKISTENKQLTILPDAFNIRV